MRRLLIAAAAMLVATAAPADEASSQVRVGKPAPDFTVTGIDGNDFQLSDITKTGKNVALMFDRAHW